MISVYIHIPFCFSLCPYCDFCKLYKNNQWISEYLKALDKEIDRYYHHEKVKTLYIGGGTPSTLNINQLKQLFKITEKLNLNKNAEITFEANSEDLTPEKLNFLKDHINRLSIGIETFNLKNLKKINRTVNISNLQNAFSSFENINLDLMYGFQNETLNDLKEDLNKIISFHPKHISTYCLIIEPHTKFYLDKYVPVDDDNERIMYDYIVKTLKAKGYKQYETSNFSQKGYESKHNLVYWNNENYYGFGLGSSGYIDNIRYENTKSLPEYLKGNYLNESHKLDLDEQIQNEFILGLRKSRGISKNKFYKKYKININDIEEVKKLEKQKILKENKQNIYINSKYTYISNEVLLNFIDISLHKH